MDTERPDTATEDPATLATPARKAYRPPKLTRIEVGRQTQNGHNETSTEQRSVSYCAAES